MGWYQTISEPLTCVVCGAFELDPEIQIPHPHVSPGWSDPEPPWSFKVGTPLLMSVYNYSRIFFHVRYWRTIERQASALISWECRGCSPGTFTRRWARAVFQEVKSEAILTSFVAVSETAEVLLKTDWLHSFIVRCHENLSPYVSVLQLGKQMPQEFLSRFVAELNARKLA